MPSISLSLADASVEEENENVQLSLIASLSQVSESNVVFSYSTLAGTAAEGIDYIGVQEAQIIIPAGQTEQTINITILGDELDEQDETFQVLAFNLSNATIADGEAECKIIDDDSNTSNQELIIPDSGFTSPDSYPNKQLVWSDEFQQANVDENSWSFETGTGSGGWGNNEAQYYREENTYIVNEEFLVIEAREEPFAGNSYTSSRMITEDKQEFQYGRIDVRAALPKGQGIWPAIWMLGANFRSAGWPACGEVDIMELLGHQSNRVYGSLHYRNEDTHAFTTSSKILQGDNNFHDQFHVFSIDWKEDEIRFLVDDEQYGIYPTHELSDEENPFNKPFFLILNVAVGGDWPGYPDQSTAFPQRMIVDYVRVFQ